MVFFVASFQHPAACSPRRTTWTSSCDTLWGSLRLSSRLAPRAMQVITLSPWHACPTVELVNLRAVGMRSECTDTKLLVAVAMACTCAQSRVLPEVWVAFDVAH